MEICWYCEAPDVEHHGWCLDLDGWPTWFCDRCRESDPILWGRPVVVFPRSR